MPWVKRRFHPRGLKGSEKFNCGRPGFLGSKRTQGTATMSGTRQVFVLAILGVSFVLGI
jgi:hypothetical protein